MNLRHVSIRCWAPDRTATYMLDECALVLEGVTLAEMVKFVVKVLIDLAAGTVLD
jgi:hypothetical protein